MQVQTLRASSPDAGAVLPYDDAGIDDLEIAGHHIAHFGGNARDQIILNARNRAPPKRFARRGGLPRRVRRKFEAIQTVRFGA
jgi:hypothetical protein